jgi:hypothetical protein
MENEIVKMDQMKSQLAQQRHVPLLVVNINVDLHLLVANVIVHLEELSPTITKLAQISTNVSSGVIVINFVQILMDLTIVFARQAII